MTDDRTARLAAIRERILSWHPAYGHIRLEEAELLLAEIDRLAAERDEWRSLVGKATGLTPEEWKEIVPTAERIVEVVRTLGALPRTEES